MREVDPSEREELELDRKAWNLPAAPLLTAAVLPPAGERPGTAAGEEADEDRPRPAA